jgi:phosphoglycolate phosphatase
MSNSFAGKVVFSPSFAPRPSIKHVLFDFDGTLSLIREGWPAVMLGMFLEMLPRRTGEEVEDRQMLWDDMMRLNGKQTIYQMMQFADRIRERGSQPQEPLWYKHEYLRRLDEKIAARREAIRTGAVSRDKYLVCGSIGLLEELRQRGLRLYLASGTDEPFVKAEAELLGMVPYFGSHVYGALDDYKKFSKKMVIERILHENQVPGEQLLALGDGYVEIQNTKEVGGLAVAVASDEANNGSGEFDAWKRNRLLEVGADVVIPDFRDAVPLLRCILDGAPRPDCRNCYCEGPAMVRE